MGKGAIVFTASSCETSYQYESLEENELGRMNTMRKAIPISNQKETRKLAGKIVLGVMIEEGISRKHNERKSIVRDRRM